jgi:di/tricarboxylate transporter
VTLEIALTLLILLGAAVLFISEWIRADLVALLVLGALAVAGLVTPEQAISGFSSPAVITVWAVFILSGALSRTGVANRIGHQILRLGGQGELSMMVVLMVGSALMSAFMNNVGVVALMLPVALTISRRTGIARSKLLMPLAFGSLLGGMITLIGTPPNLLASNALLASGFTPFSFFDFAPTGLTAMLVGTAFMALLGRRLLPTRDISREYQGPGGKQLDQVFELQEQLFVLRLPDDSALAGRTLSQSRIGSALGLNVIGVIHNGATRLAPEPGTKLAGGDRLLVTGRPDQIAELRHGQYMVAEEAELSLDDLVSLDVDLVEVTLTPEFEHLGKTLQESDFRHKYGLIALAIWRDGVPIRTNLDNLPLLEEDLLLVQGTKDAIERLRQSREFRVSGEERTRIYQLHERLIQVTVPEESSLVGKTLAESRIAQGFGLTVLGIARDGTTLHMVPAGEKFQAGDRLLLKGRAENLDALRGLQNLQVEEESPTGLSVFDSEHVGLVEAVLSPHTTKVGKTLRQLHFREKYGLSVLAIWREGEVVHSNLGEVGLRFGDALLLFGTREKLKVLAADPDFLLLSEDVQEPLRTEKAPVSALIMLGMVVSVVAGWLPIQIAAVIAAALMVLSGSLTMEEAYRYIEWRAVFLIAAMIPMGIALETSGAAELIAGRAISRVEAFGPLALIASLYLLTALGAQIIPSAVVIVLMAPIAIQASQDLALSPYALMIAVTVAASSSFMSPVGHAANVLIMGPGGYRFKDYLKVGLPLTVVVLVVTLLVLPVFWPLR